MSVKPVKMWVPGRPQKKLEPATPTREEFLPFVEKYRPKDVESIKGQEHVMDMLKIIVEQKGKAMTHMLLFGPPGTGKTTAAHAMCRQMFGDDYLKNNVKEMNASDERGIDTVRQKVKHFASQAVGQGKNQVGFKVIILDEADSMTVDGQSALRRIIEQYVGITRFIIICNYQSKIIPPLFSRCTGIHFMGLSEDFQKEQLKMIAMKEKIDVEEAALEEMIKASDGDLRRSTTLLEAVRHNKPVTPQVVKELTGTPPEDLIQNLIKAARSARSMKDVLAHTKEINRQGFSAHALTTAIMRAIEDIEGSELMKAELIISCSEIEGALMAGASTLAQTMDLMRKLYETFKRHQRQSQPPLKVPRHH